MISRSVISVVKHCHRVSPASPRDIGDYEELEHEYAEELRGRVRLRAASHRAEEELTRRRASETRRRADVRTENGQMCGRAELRAASGNQACANGVLRVGGGAVGLEENARRGRLMKSKVAGARRKRLEGDGDVDGDGLAAGLKEAIAELNRLQVINSISKCFINIRVHVADYES